MTLIGRTLRAFLACLTILLVVLSARPPLPAAGVIERVAVDLILVDVEARDARGRPMRGLKAEDFEVIVGGLRRRVASVDDLCGCSPEEGSALSGAGALRSGPGATGKADDPPAGAKAAEPARIVLYFDFSLMDLDARVEALRDARRWIQERLRPPDEVMLVGATWAGGVVVGSEFTSDRAVLAEALDRMKASRALVDPHVSGLGERILQCKREHDDNRAPEFRSQYPDCNANAFTEYQHGSGVVKAMARFLETLEEIPGPKQLVMMHQILALRPAIFYPDARLQSTHEQQIRDAAGAAVAARVTVHGVAVGDGGSDAAALLSDWTGGKYAGGPEAILSQLDALVGRCDCRYRIGIEPLERDRGRVVEVSVRVARRHLATLQVKVSTDEDRWLRRARGVLARPSAARDLPVGAALVPVAATPRGWEVRVQVNLPTASLTRLATGPRDGAEWEAGALVTREAEKGSWDLLGVSSLAAPRGAAAPEWVLHQHALPELAPGRYKLGAFVRDRTVDLFGGASALLELPGPSARGVLGPIVFLSGRKGLVADLPLQPARGSAPSRGRIGSDLAVLPADGTGDLRPGPPYEIRSWVCGAGGDPASPPALKRYLGFEESVVHTFDEATWENAGRCLRLTDRVEAGLLDDAPYRYHLRWEGAAGEGAIEAEVPLP